MGGQSHGISWHACRGTDPVPVRPVQVRYPHALHPINIPVARLVFNFEMDNPATGMHAAQFLPEMIDCKVLPKSSTYICVNMGSTLHKFGGACVACPSSCRFICYTFSVACLGEDLQHIEVAVSVELVTCIVAGQGKGDPGAPDFMR